MTHSTWKSPIVPEVTYTMEQAFGGHGVRIDVDGMDFRVCRENDEIVIRDPDGEEVRGMGRFLIGCRLGLYDTSATGPAA